MHRSISPLSPPLLVVLATLCTFGCGGEEGSSSGNTTTSTPTFEYPMDDVLRLNHLQAKGTHNSYHIAPGSDLIPQLEYTHAPLEAQLSNQGVRQIELDVRYD